MLFISRNDVSVEDEKIKCVFVCGAEMVRRKLGRDPLVGPACQPPPPAAAGPHKHIISYS